MGQTLKKRLVFLAKLALAAGIIYWIFHRILANQDASRLAERLSELSWPLVALCPLTFLVAIAANVVRWKLLLEGQGIHAKPGYLLSTFWIARFFSAAG